MTNLSFLGMALALLLVASLIVGFEVRRYRKALRSLNPDLILADRANRRFSKRLSSMVKRHV